MSTKKGKRINNKKDKKNLEKTKKYKVENKKKTEEKSELENTRVIKDNAAIKNSKVKKEKSKKNSKNKKKIWKKVLLGLIIFGAIAIMIGVAIVIGIFTSDKYKVSRDELIIKNFNTNVLDAEGNVIATLNGDENRKWVAYAEMPEYLPKMFIALEDERYYEHHGIDLKRTIGATAGFIFGGGSSSYGGSTITQQLIKNTFKDDEDSGLAGVQRKIREMARAYNVENVLSKTEILELYLNKIFMGGTYYGVQTASEYYFSKNVQDLSLAEAAYLVGINTSPNAYEPFSTEQEEIDRIKYKTKVVLEKFKEEAPNLEYELTDEVYNAALAEVDAGLAFQKGSVTTGANSYTYHTAAAIEQIIKQLQEEKELTYDAARAMIYNNGYTIYTTQKTSVQNAMQEEYYKDKYIKTSKTTKDENGNFVHSQSAMVIIDHTNGQVVGTMGGLGTDSLTSGQNRATQSTRQPGSSIKPISVIAPALEKGVIVASTVFDNSTTTFGGNFTPSSSTSGLTTVRHGIEISSNIMQCKILSLLGVSNSISFTKNMGITSLVTSKEDSIHNDESLPSMALGGLTNGVSPLEMAAAYAAIANNGEYISPTFYTKVVDSDGNTIIECKQETRQVMSAQNAYVLKKILTEPVRGNGGTATTCWISGMEVGAKTGTTNDNYDRWLCGITPYYAAATWTGFDKNEDINRYYYGNPSAQLWGTIMRAIHKELPNKSFDRPSGVVTAKICMDSGKVAVETCTRTETEYFVRGTVPGACAGHEKVTICKQTGKIATEKCPEVEEKTLVTKPETENTRLWVTKEDGKYDVPTENCDVHKVVEVEMPNVVGKKLADAKKTLEDKKLKVEIVYEENKDKDNGIVIKQSVKEKEKVTEGTTITLTVNKIKEPEEKPEDNKPEENTNTQTNTTVTNTTDTETGGEITDTPVVSNAVE